ncbi:MAG: hypothetical protein IJK89_00360 [Clostridia bacterium]|nr:hypothetical protein [Clostridia bacterium]
MKIEKRFDRLQVGEHASRKLRVTLESELAGYAARLAFLTPEGKSYVSGALSFTDGTAEYALPGALTDGPGLLLAQLVVYNGEEFIRKSPVQEYTVFPSVGMNGVELNGAEPEDMGDLNDPSTFYQAFLIHAHDDLYYRKAELDALLEGKAEKNAALTTGTDREAYLNDTLRCIASYLVREADCDCVSRPWGTDMFSAVYNDTGRSYLHLYNQGSGPFTWNERTQGGYHKLYCNCSGFLALITKCRDYLSSPYKKAFDQLDCHIVGDGCTVFNKNGVYSLGDKVIYRGKAYLCISATTGIVFDAHRWMEMTVPEFSLKYMRYEETKTYAAGDYALVDGSLYRCVTAADNEAWDPAKWEFIRGGLTLKDSVMLAFSTEKGNIHEKPYTMDFKNLIYTYYMAFIQDHSGNPLKSILKRTAGSGFYYPAAVSSAENFRQLEDGDLLFFARPQGRYYRRISHCGYYLSSLDRLNAIGVSEYGGITFSAVDHGTDSGPEWGYVVECAGSFPEGSGRNTLRISTLKGMMNNSGTDNPYYECFFSKPYANPFNSTKTARLTSFTSSTDDRLWFGNRVSNKFVTDPDGVPYGSYWLQPGDGKAHMHTVTAASLGAEGYLLSRMLPHGLEYGDYPDETLDINFIQNGVYRCDHEDLADRLTDGNGLSRLPAGMTADEKVFMLVQVGGIEEEVPQKARYGVQMIFPSLAANGTIWLRSRNEGYYDAGGSVIAPGDWGAWKKIVTFDSIPPASASVPGLVRVGNGLTASGGTVSVDPNGSFTALNVGITGVKLTAGTDLDTLGNGVWRCDTSDLAASILHKPPVATNDLRAFTLVEYGSVTISSSVSRYGVQVFSTNPSSGMPEIFIRHRGYSGGWQTWQKHNGSVDPDSWHGVKTMVRTGLHNACFSVRDQLVSQRGGVELTWNVIGKNVDTPTDAELRNSMTLQLCDSSPYYMQFDAPEAFYYCADGLPAGTYYFKIDPNYDPTYNTYKDTGYQFSLAHAVPAGGQLTFSWSQNTQAGAANVKSYASGSSMTAIDSVGVSSGTSGTYLGQLTTTGDFANNRNSITSVRFGSNNYKESAIRQWLNSSATAGNVWTPKTKFDRPPSWAATADGFMHGMDPDFLSAIGKTHLVTARNTVNDGGGFDETDDFFFLLSKRQVYGGDETASVSEGNVYPFYGDHSDLPSAGTGADANRIQYDVLGSAVYWWLRTPVLAYSSATRLIYPNGSVSSTGAFNSSCVCPACNII